MKALIEIVLAGCKMDTKLGENETCGSAALQISQNGPKVRPLRAERPREEFSDLWSRILSSKIEKQKWRTQLHLKYIDAAFTETGKVEKYFFVEIDSIGLYLSCKAHERQVASFPTQVELEL